MPKDRYDPEQLKNIAPICPTADPDEQFVPSFFTMSEMSWVSKLTERIVPTDEYSRGARAAGVPQFIDAFLAASPNHVQQEWRDGLASLDEISHEMFNRKISEISSADQVQLLSSISQRERAPVTPAEVFFRTLKIMTWNVYYRSAVGIHEELRHRRSVSVGDFTGCSHQEHH